MSKNFSTVAIALIATLISGFILGLYVNERYLHTQTINVTDTKKIDSLQLIIKEQKKQLDQDFPENVRQVIRYKTKIIKERAKDEIKEYNKLDTTGRVDYLRRWLVDSTRAWLPKTDE